MARISALSDGIRCSIQPQGETTIANRIHLSRPQQVASDDHEAAAPQLSVESAIIPPVSKLAGVFMRLLENVMRRQEWKKRLMVVTLIGSWVAGCGEDRVVFEPPEERENSGGAFARDAVTDGESELEADANEDLIEFDGECLVEGEQGRCAIGGVIEGVCVQLHQPMPEVCNGGDDNCDGIIDGVPDGVIWEELFELEKDELRTRLAEAGEPPVDLRGTVCPGGDCFAPGPQDYRAETATRSLRDEAIAWMESNRNGSACLD